MLDHTDGPEAAAAGKTRMLEGHAPGRPQEKRRKLEERGVNPAMHRAWPQLWCQILLQPRSPARLLPSEPSEQQRRKSQCKNCARGRGGLKNFDANFVAVVRVTQSEF